MIGRPRVFVSANKLADALGFRRKRAIAALGLSFLLEEEAQQPRNRNRKVYMRDWIALREEREIYHQLVKELKTLGHVFFLPKYAQGQERPYHHLSRVFGAGKLTSHRCCEA